MDIREEGGVVGLKQATSSCNHSFQLKGDFLLAVKKDYLILIQLNSKKLINQYWIRPDWLINIEFELLWSINIEFDQNAELCNIEFNQNDNLVLN